MTCARWSGRSSRVPRGPDAPHGEVPPRLTHPPGGEKIATCETSSSCATPSRSNGRSRIPLRRRPPPHHRGNPQVPPGRPRLKELGVRPERIISSPLVRARQTAEILRDTVAPDLDLTIEPHLEPGADFEATARVLLPLTEETVAVVGHEPHVSGFTAFLLAGPRAARGTPLQEGGGGARHVPRAAPAGRRDPGVADAARGAPRARESLKRGTPALRPITRRP